MLDKIKRLAKSLTPQQIKDLETPLLLGGLGVFCIVCDLFLKQTPGALVYAGITIPYAVLEAARVVYIPGDRRVQYALAIVFGGAFIFATMVFTPALTIVGAIVALVAGMLLLWRRRYRRAHQDEKV